MGLISLAFVSVMVVVAQPPKPAAVITPQARAQTSARTAPSDESNLEFEVVSIKQNRSGNQGSIMGPPRGDRFTYTNVTLQMLMTVAYRVQNFQISGGPSWLNSERYDIVAKFEDPTLTAPQLQKMLQTMLEKRFLLAVHRESKEMPIYALVPARADGRWGPDLKHSPEAPCPTAAPSPSVPPPGQLPNPVCGQIIFRRNQMKGQQTPLSGLASVLSTVIGRNVVDHTGLMGRFDLSLEWTPDEILPGRGPEPVTTHADPAGPSIFTALQEQLGLKLVSERGPVEILVIDRAEKASDNNN